MSAARLDRDRGGLCVTSTTSRGSRNIRHGDSNRATHRLSSLGAKVVVAAHPTDSIVTEDAMTIAIMLSVAGLGFLCWLAFNLAVYALPFFAAVAGGLFAYHTGAGPIGGAAIAMAAGATTLVAGQFAFAHSRSMILRTMIAAAFALPAAIAGYHLVLGVSTMGMPSDTWRHVFAIVGAAVVGATAWARLVSRPSDESAACAADPALPHG
jgi:hypothetical protein